ncbi:hypothetical protein SLEP1_g12167 [Rubroshorea leprosula]|nr:hypothetical protein SLEP1_g12167 [Rubroshorea leprosula]
MPPTAGETPAEDGGSASVSQRIIKIGKTSDYSDKKVSPSTLCFLPLLLLGSVQSLDAFGDCYIHGLQPSGTLKQKTSSICGILTGDEKAPNNRLKDVEICVPIVCGTITFYLGRKASEGRYCGQKWHTIVWLVQEC